MSARSVVVALTETRNVYADMPASLDDVGQVADRLDAIRDANLRHHEELIAAAAATGAQIVGLGELFSAPYFALHRDPMWRGLAEDAHDGPSVAAMRRCAQQHGIVIVAPIYELTPDGRRFNTAVVIDESGEVLGKYRKTHIPEGTNEQAGFAETFYYERSDGDLGPSATNVSRNPHFPVFRTSVGTLGVAICYDRHFEGVIASLAGNGAELIFSPAVTFGAQSERMWRIEFATDAARHHVFIAGSNRRGAEPPFDVTFFGDSHVVGPDGEVGSSRPRPEVVVAKIDLDALGRTDSSGWDLARDARPDIV